jgi:Protein of unknown function (DUF1186)/SEC-C motif
MDAAAILNELTHSEGLPKAALLVASARRDEMAPVFLREIDSYLSRDAAERGKPTALFFIFHLLGEWRERAAYRPLARLLRCPRHEIDALLGDALTSTSHRVMAAVFDGDPEPLQGIILDPEADEFVRSRMCEALAMVVRQGELNRAVAGRFLRDAYMELRPQAECYVWDGWQSAIAMLGLSELQTLVKRAFDRGFVAPEWLCFEDFREDLDRAVERPGKPRYADHDEYTLFGDTIDELSGWYAFSDDYLTKRKQWQEEDELEFDVSEPYRNPFRGVGRNDPCPCGSSKKFKNCCLPR